MTKKYPRIEVDLKKITHNTKEMVKVFGELGVKIAGINKVTCGSVEVANALIDGGVKVIGESRIEALKKLKDINAEKMLVRLPMISNAAEVVKYADISLNSEIKTIRKLSEEALKIGKKHKVVLMIDVGDLREGIFDEEEALKTAGHIIELPGVELDGLGTNLSCFGGIMPSEENLEKLNRLKKRIEEKYNIKMNTVSGGNSSTTHLIQKEKLPKFVNQLRCGTLLMLGTVEVTESRMDNTFIDAFILKAEIIELKKKPSKPIGTPNVDAFGNIPEFEDKGEMTRAICAIGRQDVDLEWMKAVDINVEILGGSSDHAILDLTRADGKYDIGDILEFELNYVAILRGMTSPFVYKEYVK